MDRTLITACTLVAITVATMLAGFALFGDSNGAVCARAWNAAVQQTQRFNAGSLTSPNPALTYRLEVATFRATITKPGAPGLDGCTVSAFRG